MGSAPERAKIFELVNGKRSTKDISASTKRHINSVRRDLNILADTGLIEIKVKNGVEIKNDGFPIYDKVSLARTIPIHYFTTPSRLPTSINANENLQISSKKSQSRKQKPLSIPSEQEVLEISRRIGENQIYEFKAQGTEPRKITREISAMLNTSQGGVVFYGIDDDGNIEGSDVSLSKFDQPLQNSIKDNISPAATVHLHSISVLGSTIIAIIVPPWNKNDVYQFDGKILLRKGTNVFGAKPEEVKKLHQHKTVI
jgi:predicted HTH transcriptional regulator